MNETSASISRAERAHVAKLTWRAWVGRTIVLLLAFGFGRMLYDGHAAIGMRSWERSMYMDFAIAAFALSGFMVLAALVLAVVYFIAHINERE